jgi:hypothetical protein
MVQLTEPTTREDKTMTTRRTFIAAAMLMLSSLALTAQTADITGTWTAKFETQVGEQEYTYEFVVKGTTLTGTATGNLLGKSEIADGKVEGSTITFIENGNYMGMPLRIEYSGTVASNGEIKFTRKIGDFGAEEFVAKRTK